MKTSLKKLRGFALHKHNDAKERRERLRLPQSDELSQASQDVRDMRDCYDSLLSAAAATTNSAYEFSESLQELGACLLEKTALSDDEESGKVLIMLGKVQYELQKLVDCYRSHIFRTITIPSESLLNELQTVEEMKLQCDEKRKVYEDMIMKQREKGKSRIWQGEHFSSQQLQQARDEYDDEATLFVFRLKSLKQGQSRSLLTQAARHHAAQLCFFRKALKSLEAVEPHVKLVTEQQHIDYQFSGLEDDDGEDGDGDDNDYDSENSHDDGELSFDYGQNEQVHNIVSTGSSMELDQVDLTFPQVTVMEAAKENIDKSHGDFSAYSEEFRTGSQSAPLFAENKFDLAEWNRRILPSTSRKLHSYVLPRPNDTKSLTAAESVNSVPHTRHETLSGHTLNLWHSSPLEPRKYEQVLGDEKFSGPNIFNVQSVLKESNNNSAATRLGPPLSEGLSFSHLNPRAASDAKKIKRQAFSGPLTSKPRSTKPVLSGHGPFASVEHLQLFSGPLLRNPVPQPSSALKVSPSTSLPFVSSPKISELHELPRPPATLTSKYQRTSGLVGHSGPLVSRGQKLSATNKSVVSNAASPLPRPPQTVPRSLSIPSRVTALHVSEPLEAPHNSEMAADVPSPPLTPLSIPGIQPASTAETVVQDD